MHNITVTVPDDRPLGEDGDPLLETDETTTQNDGDMMHTYGDMMQNDGEKDKEGEMVTGDEVVKKKKKK